MLKRSLFMTRFILTVVVMLVVVGVVLAATGVLRFRNTEDETGVTIDKKELKEKTEQAVEKTEKVGGEILDKTGKSLQKAAEGLRGSPQDKEVPAVGSEGTRQPDGDKNPPEHKQHESER
jgi:hypothetical protein